jgi:glyoxylase-like metal-dependent hydrolase (beta-lactamase superfamily II)
VVRLADRPLLCLHTPGHARHHHCLWDAQSQGWFTGDTFGLAYPECHSAQGPWLMPTSSPVQFEPEALHDSLRRLMAHQPRWLYLTHYGRVPASPGVADMLHRQIDQMVALALICKAAPDRHQVLRGRLQALAQAELQAHGVADVPAALAAIALDIELNAQGLGVWLDRPGAA